MLMNAESEPHTQRPHLEGGAFARSSYPPLEDQDEQEDDEDDGQEPATAPGGRMAFFLLADAPGNPVSVLQSRHSGFSFLALHYPCESIANVSRASERPLQNHPKQRAGVGPRFRARKPRGR
jgi:hypothetical protein